MTISDDYDKSQWINMKSLQILQVLPCEQRSPTWETSATGETGSNDGTGFTRFSGNVL